MISVGMLLFSCASLSPSHRFGSHPATIPLMQGEGKAILYIYRPSRLWADLINPTVSLNNEEVFLLKNNSYAALCIDAGTHDLKIELSEKIRQFWGGIRYVGPENHQLHFASGRRYYLRVLPDYSFRPMGTLFWIAETLSSFFLFQIVPFPRWPEVDELPTELFYSLELAEEHSAIHEISRTDQFSLSDKFPCIQETRTINNDVMSVQ